VKSRTSVARAVSSVAVLLGVVAVWATVACSSAWAAPSGGVDLSHLVVGYSQVATGFSQPSGIVNAGDHSGRLFVLEQTGLVKVVRDGVVQPEPYLDMRSSIATDSYELGLESIVFSPTFATTGRLYVYYTAPGKFDVLERLTVSDPATDTPTVIKRTVLIKQQKKYIYHHGGGMAFGRDGYLYIGFGDGGRFRDPHRYAQDKRLLLGKILRIDPGDKPGAAPFDGTYRIPKTNPFYKNKKGYRKEIWASGLRNPWRLTFDSATGDLWISDVGQDRREEIDFQKASSKGGENYGWPYWEGTLRYPETAKKALSRKGFTFPITWYAHPYGETVVGGYVYRGSASPALFGTYLYADWYSGWMGAIRRTSPTGQLLAKRQLAKVASTGAMISTFGVDEAREPYFVDWAGGILYRISATTN
jgi:glucose/arabinose dehydrogenase